MKRINTSFWRISLFLWLLCLPLATFAEDFINKEGAMMAYQGSSQSSIKMKIMFDDWGSRHYYVKKLQYTGRWDFWQHSDRGQIDGIRGDVDVNVYNGSMYNLRQLTIP